MNDFIGYCLATKNYSAIKAVKMYGETAKKIAKGTGLAALTAATGAGLYTTEPIGRMARKAASGITGNDYRTTADKAHDWVDEGNLHINMLPDETNKTIDSGANKLVDYVNDSKVARALREKSGETTLRDRVLNLKDKITGDKDESIVENFVNKHGFKSTDEAIDYIKDHPVEAGSELGSDALNGITGALNNLFG